ncbi:MAG: ABC transporter ATP-binding protein [Chloroflexi bacterium]|nr:ABC transporter ATP-binding protein [Chloroflexota bacterium]
MPEPVIRLENISKQYRIGMLQERPDTLRDVLTTSVKRAGRLFTRRSTGRDDSPSYIWALKDISFEVERGQVLGIVGRNGAGKSTLLKILSRVTDPTLGFGEIRGRVGSLLEVGTGFHPELSGRENIYLNGAILGMRREEIDRKFDEIVEFSEVAKFIDTPVKRFSSGMYLRLAFAVAAHLEPEILVVDEVLAVGDAEFQRKCLGKMSDVAQEGRAVLFVSHNMSAILRLTQETIVLDQGKMVMRAPTPDAVDHYLNMGLTKQGERYWDQDPYILHGADFVPVALRVLNPAGEVVDTVNAAEGFSIELVYQLTKEISGLRVGIYMMTTRGEFVFTSFDTDDARLYDRYVNRGPGRYISRCEIPPDLMNEGRYILGVNASTYRIQRYFQDDKALTFTVDATGAPGTQWPEPRLGPVRPKLAWKIGKVER